MNGEHLLEAVGLLDDDLIAQAEEPVRARRPGPVRRRWAALAACLALALVVGVVGKNVHGDLVTNAASGGAPPEAAQGSGSPSSGGSAPDMGASPGEPGAATGDSSTNSSREVLIVVVQEGDRVWSYQHWYEEDRALDALPEGCRSLGRVGVYAEGEDCVYTDMGEFPGAPLWIAGEDMEGPVYLELPQGGYLECRRA